MHVQTRQGHVDISVGHACLPGRETADWFVPRQCPSVTVTGIIPVLLPFLSPTYHVVLSICQATFSRKERSLSSAPAQLVNLAGFLYTVWCSSLSLGKSSLVIQFTENQFIESYYPTIESTHTKSVSYKGVDYDCDIIDTAGQVCVLS